MYVNNQYLSNNNVNGVGYKIYTANPYKFNIAKFCFNTKPFSDNLNKVIDNEKIKITKLSGINPSSIFL